MCSLKNACISTIIACLCLVCGIVFYAVSYPLVGGFCTLLAPGSKLALLGFEAPPFMCGIQQSTDEIRKDMKHIKLYGGGTALAEVGNNLRTYAKALLTKEYSLSEHPQAHADVIIARTGLSDLAEESLTVTRRADSLLDDASNVMTDASVAMTATKQMLISMKTAVINSATKDISLQNDDSFKENHKNAYNLLAKTRSRLTLLRESAQQLQASMSVHISNAAKSQSNVNKLAGETEPVATTLKELQQNSPWSLSSYTKAGLANALCIGVGGIVGAAFGGAAPLGMAAAGAVCGSGSALKYNHDFEKHHVQKNDLRVVVNDARDMLPILKRYERRLVDVANGISRFEGHIHSLSAHVGSASKAMNIQRYTLPLLRTIIESVDETRHELMSTSDQLVHNKKIMT